MKPNVNYKSIVFKQGAKTEVTIHNLGDNTVCFNAW